MRQSGDTTGPHGGQMCQHADDPSKWSELCPACNGSGLANDPDDRTDEPAQINCPACKGSANTGYNEFV